MVGAENRGQVDGENAGNAEQDAVEERDVEALLGENRRIGEIEPREARSGEFDDIGDGRAGLEHQPVDVGIVVFDAFGLEAQRHRQIGDAGGIEIGPDHLRADHLIALCHQP